MALWWCKACTTAYSVGAPCCPHCQATDHTEEEPVANWICTGCRTVYRLKLHTCPRCKGTDFEEEKMPKITVHGGATNADAAAAIDRDAEPAVTVEVNGVDFGPGEEGTTGPGAEVDTTDDVEFAVDAPADTDARDLYEAQTVEDLKVELDGRGLPKSGNKDALVARLLEDDAKPAAETTED